MTLSTSGWIALVVLLSGGSQGASVSAAHGRAEEPEAVLVCRAVDSSGQPVAGATVEVVHVLTRQVKSYFESRKYSQVGASTHEPVERTVASGRTDESGEFAVKLPRGRPFEVRPRADGWVAKTETNRYAGERVEVVMYRPGAITGIVRTVNDMPIRSGSVVLSRQGSWYWSTICACPITADGTYRAEGLLPGRYTVTAEWSDVSDGVDVAEGETREVNLKTKPPPVQRDIALDDARRKPTKEALLAPERTVRGRLLDPEGKPVGEARVAAVSRSYHVDAGSFELRETTSLEDGSFELAGLQARRRHTLCAWKENWAPLFFDMPAEERSKNEWDVGALTFARPGGLSGSVVGEDGLPLSGVEIRLNGAAEPQAEPALNGPDGKPLLNVWEYTHFRDGRSLRTDEKGGFLMIDLAPGRYSLHFGPRRPGIESGLELEIAQGEVKQLGAITLPASVLDR